MAQPVKTKDKKMMRMAGQPMALSRTPSRLRRRRPGWASIPTGARGIRLQRQGDRSAAQGQGRLTRCNRQGMGGGRAMDDVTKAERNRQDAGAQGRARRLRDLQQPRAPQRGVARHVGSDHPHSGRFRRRRRGSGRGAHRRWRQGLRVRRRHIEIRERAGDARRHQALQCRRSRRPMPASRTFPSRPSP